MAAVVKRGFTSYTCQSCRQRLLPHPIRSLTTTSTLCADKEISITTSNPAQPDAPSIPSPQPSKIIHERRREGHASLLGNSASHSDVPGETAESLLDREYGSTLSASQHERPYRMHVLAHKHNTHITLVQPPKLASQTANFSTIGSSASDQKKIVDVLLSLSAGNIGFKKSGRGSYDAAYQLAAFFLKQVQEKGFLRDMNKLEVVLRGFGAGREAVTKVLLGTEGRRIRGKITAVLDATRLKLGGIRGKKPRRLG